MTRAPNHLIGMFILLPLLQVQYYHLFDIGREQRLRAWHTPRAFHKYSAHTDCQIGLCLSNNGWNIWTNSPTKRLIGRLIKVLKTGLGWVTLKHNSISLITRCAFRIRNKAYRPSLGYPSAHNASFDMLRQSPKAPQIIHYQYQCLRSIWRFIVKSWRPNKMLPKRN